MPQLIGIARLGRDAELRYTQGQNSQAVINLALAFNYGRKGDDGNRPTQWVDASLWGPRAEKLAEYLVKGQAVYVVVDDVHVETYEGRNGTGHKLVGTVSTLEFAGPPPEQGQGQQRQQRAPAPAPRQQRQAPAPQSRGSTGFDDMDDDIPF
jgi:single-strand DNA-binding protein